MKPLLLISTILLVGGCRAPLSEQLVSEGGTAEVDSCGLNYRVWLPDGYETEPERTYPLLVWFHRGGDDEFGWGRAGWIGELVQERVREGQLQPFIVVSPSAGTMTPIFSRYERALKEQLIPEVRGKYRVNNVTLAFGFSMGGLSALMVSLRNPELFDAVAVANPFALDTSPWDSQHEQVEFDRRYGGSFNDRWRDTAAYEFLTEEEYRAQEPFSLLRAGVRLKVPLLLATSRDDWLGLYPHNLHLHEALQEAGVEHTLLVMGNAGHITLGHPFLMDWLNRQAKAASH